MVLNVSCTRKDVLTLQKTYKSYGWLRSFCWFWPFLVKLDFALVFHSRIYIPICGLRMKLFNFISHYFNFFERHFFLSLSECIGVLNWANHKVKVEITCSQKVVFFLWKRVWRRFTLRMRISYKKAFFTCFALEWAFLEFLM